jgi:hypothetical protein
MLFPNVIYATPSGESPADDRLPFPDPATLPTVEESALYTGRNLVIPKASGEGIKLDQDAPVYGWRDIIGAVAPKASGAGSPTRRVYAGGTLADYSFTTNDVCDFVYHIPHDYVPGTDLFFHVHWSHNGTSISGNAVFDVFHSYSKGHNQAEFPAEKQLNLAVSTPNIGTVPRYRHRVDEIIMSGADATATLMDRDLVEVDGLILATLRMTTLPTIGSGILFIHTCDIHYQSSNMATVNKAPNFYGT